MDMALARGVSIRELEATTSEREFAMWARYDAQRILPWRRLELHLAQVSMLIVQTMGGGKNLKLADFLFEPVQTPAIDAAVGSEVLAGFAGVGIRRLSQGRRRKTNNREVS